MRTPPSTVQPGGQALAVAIICVGLFGAWWPVAAPADAPLYEVIVPLSGTGAAEREVGMAEALGAVAVKASGQRDAASSPAIRGANPAKYVQRYSMTADKQLKVGFDGAAVERLLEQAGLPLWPAERPVTLVNAPAADPAAIEAAAQQRGLPIAWASGAGVDASGRAVLTGVPSGAGFSWSFTHDGRTTQATGSAQDGIHLAADTLAARYAPASTRSSRRLTLAIGGMDDLSDYSGLLEYLGSLSLVRDVQVESLQGDVVRLSMVVRGDRELLARIAALDGRLQAVAPAGEGGPPAVDFVYQP